MSTSSSRPDWAPVGIQKPDSARWPSNNDSERKAALEADFRVRVHYSETGHPSTAAKAKFGDWVQFESKVVSGRKDIPSDDIYIFYDRYYANLDRTRVVLETVCEKFDKFKRDYPRAILPFMRSHDIRNNPNCNSNVPGYPVVDDWEDSFLGGVTFDKQDPEGHLNMEAKYEMNEGGIKVEWETLFE